MRVVCPHNCLQLFDVASLSVVVSHQCCLVSENSVSLLVCLCARQSVSYMCFVLPDGSFHVCLFSLSASAVKQAVCLSQGTFAWAYPRIGFIIAVVIRNLPYLETDVIADMMVF